MKAQKIFFVSRILLLLILGLLFPPTTSHAAPGDQYWDTRFGAPGLTNNILAMTVHNGILWAGGYASPSTNATLSFWDGNQWSTNGIFYSSGFAYLYDAAYVGNTLYVAGIFSSVNGIPANGLARWDGTAWTSIGFSGSGVCLAVSGNDLYVGGIFTNLDNSGVMMTNIGVWDGSAWHALGGGLGVTSGSFVRNLAVNGGLLYASGSFTNSGTQAATNLAVWDGSTWSAVGGGVNGTVYGIAVNGGDLYAVGVFTQAGSTPASNIAHWDGSNWYPVGGGLNAGGTSVAVFNNQVCVIGSFTSAGGVSATNFAVWNGSSWSGAGTGLSAAGLRVISNGTNVYVGGTFAAADNVFVNAVAAWDGTNWTSLGTPGRINGVQSTVFALANDDTNLYAGGLFLYAGSSNVNYVARFDGTNWSSLGGGVGPSGGSTIVRAVGVTNNNVYVGGTFSTAGGAPISNLGLWNGTNWSALGSGFGGVVSSITVRTDGVYVAGAPSGASGFGAPLFQRWDGANWNSVLNYNSSDTLIDFYINDTNIGMTAVAFMGTNIFVGGHFLITAINTNVEPNTYTQCPNIMRFDGTYAQIVGTGFNNNVVAMAVLSTNLYVAGLFTTAGGISANHIAMWNGSNWSAVGGGVVGNGTVSTLAAFDNNLYAGGTFTNMGGVAVSHIAEWDGTNWYPLGSGIAYPGVVTPSVTSLNAFGPDLYVGGIFREAGGKSSFCLARWNDQINFNTPQITNPAWLGNGQMGMQLWGIMGLTNVIQASSDLNTWVPVLTNMTGIYDFTDTSASNYTYRFYRAALEP